LEVNDAQNVRVDTAYGKDHNQQTPSKMTMHYCISSLCQISKSAEYCNAYIATKSLQMSEDTNTPVYKLVMDNLQLALIKVLITSISEH